MALSSVDELESTLTALSVTCSVCSASQPIETVPSTEPFHQLVCHQCGTNLVVLNPEVIRPSESVPSPEMTVDDSAQSQVPSRSVVLSIVLFIANLAVICLGLTLAVESFKIWYDPWDVLHPPYKPVLMAALGWSPLHLAAGQGDEQLVKTLLASGADVHARNSRGNTPLHEAAKRGHLVVVSHLLAGNSPLDAQSHDGMTALHLAASHGQPDVVKLLLIAGASVQLTATDQNMTALHLAADRGHTETVSLLLTARADVNARKASKETPLHLIAWHARQNDTDLATLLLALGADLDARDYLGFSPLNRAAREGNYRLAQLLVTRGAEIDSLGLDGTSPLHQAAWAGDQALVRLLLDHGATIDARTIDGFTPLMTAASRGHADVVRLLLDRGADPNLRAGGQTALDFAAETLCRQTSSSFSTWWLGINPFAAGSDQTSLCDPASLHILNERGGQTYAQLRHHLVHGDELSKQQQYLQALEEQSRAIALAPTDADLYDRRALTHLHLNAIPAAQQDLQQAIDLEPTYFEAYRHMTMVLTQLRQGSKIVHVWDRLLTQMPKHARARYERGIAALNQEGSTASELEQAAEDLTLACQYGYQEACTVRERTVRRQGV